MNEITGTKQNFDLLIICLIIKKLLNLGTKIDTGDKVCFDPTDHLDKFKSEARLVWLANSRKGLSTLSTNLHTLGKVIFLLGGQKGRGEGYEKCKCGSSQFKNILISTAFSLLTQLKVDIVCYSNPLLNSPVLPLSISASSFMQLFRYEREFIQVKVIGGGGFGKVFHAYHKLDGRSYAVKQVNFRYQTPVGYCGL